MISFILLISAMLISLITTPFVKKLAFKIGAIDIPTEERKIHKKPMPRIGGLSIYLSFILITILRPGSLEKYELAIIIGATIIVIGGIIDDIHELKPIAKLGFQIAAAVVLILMGVKIGVLSNPFSVGNSYFEFQFLAIPITILWIVGVTNAFNFIDGLDGLSAGLAFISSATIYVIAISNGRPVVAALTVILCGAILGFLPYNFNPASIFMGDTGSQLLGFLLAAISIEGTVKSSTVFAVTIPLLALGLPVYDTAFAMVRRKLNGKPIMAADKGHLHHRLLELGHSQRKAVLVMYSISIILGIIAIFAAKLSFFKSLFLLGISIVIIMFFAYKFGFFENKEI